MKICSECQHHTRVPIDTGRGMSLGYVCSYEECRDPVEGSPIPCATARTNESFCGLKAARYFKKKEEARKEQASNVIQLN